MAKRTYTISRAAIFLALAACGCEAKEEAKAQPLGASASEQAEPSEFKAPAAETGKEAQKTETGESTCASLAALPEELRPKISKDAVVGKVVADSGSLKLPEPGGLSTGETHTRHPWTMPKGASNAVAVIRWDDTSWGDVEFALGTGLCPHRGLKLADTISSTGTAVVHYEHSPDRAWPEPNWFLHVNADKALELKGGQELKYNYEICAY